MLALCLLIYKCLLNEKRLNGVFLPCSGHCLPRHRLFPRRRRADEGLETCGRASPCREAPRNSPGAAWKARFFLI